MESFASTKELMSSSSLSARLHMNGFTRIDAIVYLDDGRVGRTHAMDKVITI